MAMLNAEQSAQETLNDFELPDGTYFFCYDNAMVTFNESSPGDYDSYYVRVDIMLLAPMNESKHEEDVLNRIVGTKEELFFCVIKKSGEMNKRGYEELVEFIDVTGFDADEFNINKPALLKENFKHEEMPINKELGVPLEYIVMSVSRSKDKNGKLWVNKRLERACKEEEIKYLNIVAPGYIDVKQVFEEDEETKTEETVKVEEISADEIPF